MSFLLFLKITKENKPRRKKVPMTARSENVIFLTMFGRANSSKKIEMIKMVFVKIEETVMKVVKDTIGKYTKNTYLRNRQKNHIFHSSTATSELAFSFFKFFQNNTK